MLGTGDDVLSSFLAILIYLFDQMRYGQSSTNQVDRSCPGHVSCDKECDSGLKRKQEVLEPLTHCI